MYKPGGTIRDAIRRVEQNQYVLPAIQREFVWKAEQIAKLFDSLMQGYAARFAFRVLKQVYRVADFSLATFRERIPLGKEIGHVDISPPEETTEPTASNEETVYEKFKKRVDGDPRFVEAKNSSKGFVIGGAKPP